MQAEIQPDGRMLITPESDTEEYALRVWAERAQQDIAGSLCWRHKSIVPMGYLTMRPISAPTDAKPNIPQP